MKLSKRSLKHLQSVNPLLIAIIVEGIQTSPYDFGIPSTGGVRTQKEQYQLFLDGKSKCDGTIKKSNHQPTLVREMKQGNAFDIFAYIDGKASWNKTYLEAIARHLQQVAENRYNVDLEWGGDWRSWKDMPHFQL